MVYESESLIREVHLRIVFNPCVNFFNQKFWKFSEKILPFVFQLDRDQVTKIKKRLRHRSYKRNKGGLSDLLNDNLITKA